MIALPFFFAGFSYLLNNHPFTQQAFLSKEIINDASIFPLFFIILSSID